MRIFSQFKQIIAGHRDLEKKIDAMEAKYDEQFGVVFEAIKQLLKEDEKPKKKIGF
jgi:hypothetical protein